MHTNLFVYVSTAQCMGCAVLMLLTLAPLARA
jgi:hypothetical protein